MTHRLVVSMIALFLAIPVRAGLFEIEEARKALMDQQANLRSMQESIKKMDEELVQSKRSYLDLQSQNEVLLKQISELRGSLELLSKQLSDSQRAYKDLNKQFEDRFAALELRIHKLEPLRVSIDGIEFMAEPLENKDYEAALAAFRKGDFASSSTYFKRFVDQYPRSGYSPSALFWSGNSLYALRKYKEAVADFKQITEQFPNHPRVSESLLSMANCQIELKDVRTARKTLEGLVKQYPGTEAASAAQERLSKLR